MQVEKIVAVHAKVVKADSGQVVWQTRNGFKVSLVREGPEGDPIAFEVAYWHDAGIPVTPVSRFSSLLSAEDAAKRLIGSLGDKSESQIEAMSVAAHNPDWNLTTQDRDVQYWHQQGHPWNHVTCYAGSAKDAIELADSLPHGSGINYAWHVDQSDHGGDVWVLSNAYHGMDEWGGYVIPVDFTATVIRTMDGSWSVVELDVDAPDFESWPEDRDYPACWEGLDDYLATTIEQSLNE